ncbi:MAG: nucleotidyl transferase AbiEii/AbiGii toxin family protein [Proteobacteria bacterium]|nr:nucleotidyl transferase AbiEii/AbiGii toxin family protein [Pseudomonadota bacterium]
MSDLILMRMRTFKSKNIDEERQALREVIQEAALAGLWRSKFFEHAAFYGGTALRIFHGLDRFSEDLDFTLLHRASGFRLKNHLKAVEQELSAIGFSSSVVSKNDGDVIESAFVKAGTLQHLILIKSPFKAHRDELLQVKIEIDTDPALGFTTEARTCTWPYLYTVKTCDIPSLFSEKLHALLCRKVVRNVKGRDWYDFLWYLAQKTPFNRSYLEAKLIQSDVKISGSDLELKQVVELVHDKIDHLDIKAAKADIERFIRNPRQLDGWSPESLKSAASGLTMIS